jgi:2'-5' RNA ligase
MAKKRLFVGTMVSIPQFKEIKREVGEFQIEGKWVEEENLHFTYRFLGYVDEEKIPQIRGVLRSKLKNVKPPLIRYKGLGTFTRKGRLAVLWVGVESEGVLKVKEAVDRGLAVFGYPPENSFTPHVTLLRIKKARHKGKFKGYLFKMRDFVFSERVEKKVSLVESKLTPEGPKYTILEDFLLG